MDPVDAFLDVSVWHGSLDDAEAILRTHPEIRGASIHVAAVLGDDSSVRDWLARDPASAVAQGGPRQWDPLTYLCFSKYLRLEQERSAGFVQAAEGLLGAGASANTGFWEPNHQPEPEWESALYGAAGVAHHAGITRLLIEHGADANDEETPYHTPEGYDNAALQVIVESGQWTADSLAIALLRKADWHDLDGVRYLLDHGADANRMMRWGLTALHHAVRRDNRLQIIEAMLDHGADPAAPDSEGLSAARRAARRGRGDILEVLERRGLPVELRGADRLIAECARGRMPEDRSSLTELMSRGGELLAEFAGNGNREGIACLLDLGIDVAARYAGDMYWDEAAESTALHVAAWRARHSTVKLLIARGAPVEARDAKGRTALQLAIRACVDSFWSERRTTESIEALLEAGASAEGIDVPTGYPDADAILRRFQR